MWSSDANKFVSDSDSLPLQQSSSSSLSCMSDSTVMRSSRSCGVCGGTWAVIDSSRAVCSTSTTVPLLSTVNIVTTCVPGGAICPGLGAAGGWLTTAGCLVVVITSMGRSDFRRCCFTFRRFGVQPSYELRPPRVRSPRIATEGR